jgi:hypothetical protein
MKEIQEAIDRLDQLRIDITKVENDDKVERDAYEIQQLLFKAMDVVKNLTIPVVSTRLKMGVKVYKKDKTLTGFIDRKADRGFNQWIVIWNNGEQTKEYGSDLNVC